MKNSSFRKHFENVSHFREQVQCKCLFFCEDLKLVTSHLSEKDAMKDYHGGYHLYADKENFLFYTQNFKNIWLPRHRDVERNSPLPVCSALDNATRISI